MHRHSSAEAHLNMRKAHLHVCTSCLLPDASSCRTCWRASRCGQAGGGAHMNGQRQGMQVAAAPPLRVLSCSRPGLAAAMQGMMSTPAGQMSTPAHHTACCSRAAAVKSEEQPAGQHGCQSAIAPSSHCCQSASTPARSLHCGTPAAAPHNPSAPVAKAACNRGVSSAPASKQGSMRSAAEQPATGSATSSNRQQPEAQQEADTGSLRK